MNDKIFTAYCGLFCKDCIPSKSDLFDTAKALKNQLDVNRFDLYSKLRAEKQDVFKDYKRFKDFLEAVIGMQCKTPCRDGGGKADCAVRICVESKGIEGCWDCSENETCPKLDYLKSAHPDLMNRYRAIREHGLDDWSKHRGKHYQWD